VFYLDEDEDPFYEYVEELKEDGVWAGNLEIQALSQILKKNVVIHILG
jgi:OTU domain-containing protein 3